MINQLDTVSLHISTQTINLTILCQNESAICISASISSHIPNKHKQTSCPPTAQPPPKPSATAMLCHAQSRKFSNMKSDLVATS